MNFQLSLAKKGLAILVGLLATVPVLGCPDPSTTDVTADSTADSTTFSASSPDTVAPNATMTTQSTDVNGKIIEVMESWPLQLVIETATAQHYHVQLLEETTITEGETPFDVNQLTPGLQVQITGPLADQSVGIIAESIIVH